MTRPAIKAAPIASPVRQPRQTAPKKAHAKLLIRRAVDAETEATGIAESDLLLIAPRMLRRRLNDRLRALKVFTANDTIHERSLSRFLSGK